MRKFRTPETTVTRIVRLPTPHYTYGQTGSRVEPDTVYVLDGIEHTFDGTCHEPCENVR